VVSYGRDVKVRTKTLDPCEHLGSYLLQKLLLHDAQQNLPVVTEKSI
jgi:hypothetical protein